MCIEHRDEVLNCFSCKTAIDGQVLVALKKQHQFHPEHFNCATCGNNLARTSFFEKDDAPYCQKCYLDTTMRKLL